ncbi:MAG: amidohydrolase family protein [Pseudomonadota bacterium]
MTQHDLVIRNGLVFDGSGSAGFEADVALDDGRISAVGPLRGRGREELDAKGLLVTPGFVDIHTHYDGQATWDSRLDPSSEHGVTTAVMGNCGVGFAPCKPEDHDQLISLMEGVEDIPNPVLAEGLPWNWLTFRDYLDALEARPHDIDFGCQLPHGALRVFVMGRRGADRELANQADIAAMAELAEDAMRAGALGFSTSRTLNHQTAAGDPTPSYNAEERELVGIARGLKAAGTGVLQVVSDFTDGQRERSLLRNMVIESGRPMIFSLAQPMAAPEAWKSQLRWIEAENQAGHPIRAMVCGRPVGVLLGLNATMNPFSLNPIYQEYEQLPLAERVAALRDPAVKARILAAESGTASNVFNALIRNFDFMFELGDNPDYEQPQSATLAARAAAAGTTPQDIAYDLLLEDGGEALLYTPFLNYADYDLSAAQQMMQHPHTVLGLGDGGAHVGMICDGSFPTSMLTHWTRDRTRGDKLPLEWVIHSQTRKTALAFGLGDRGLLQPGYKADVNLIDYDRLRLKHPRMQADLPAGGKRLVQGVSGYAATIVSGQIIQRDGTPTGALPGKLVRGARRG